MEYCLDSFADTSVQFSFPRAKSHFEVFISLWVSSNISG